jgi:hypothetical protein
MPPHWDMMGLWLDSRSLPSSFVANGGVLYVFVDITPSGLLRLQCSGVVLARLIRSRA